ncbi:MFS transporter [Paenibacillus sp. IB182496]|uniref:MFS transporter n=1 Tax=Paenibacillus sabuli TaxID=2772509 RepID=A0A927BWF2_9BACL|nr:MFS transporter [Paenibacillus sabuli]MBD2847146.1 MFS transporter [Paenibacillus sabuli]
MSPLLRNRVFLVVAGADLLQQISIWIRNMALLFYIMEMTNNDPTAVALLSALQYAPILLFSLVGGTFADRWNPKKTVIAGDTLSALSILAILPLIAAGWWQAVFAATVVSSIVSQFSQPSSAVLFKRHVPETQVGAAIGITQSLMSLFVVLGPVLGTLIYSRFGLERSLWALVALFGAAALLQLLLPASSRSRAGGQAPASAWADLRSGFRYVLAHANLRTIGGLFLLLGLAVGVTQPLDVFVTMERLQLPKEAVQWFAASEGVGMLIGGAVAAAAAGWAQRRGRLILPLAMLVFAAVTMTEVLSLWPLLTGSVRVVSGVTMAFFQIVLSALLIREVAEAYIGRTNGIITPLMMGGMLAGTALSGPLVKLVSLFGAYGLSALLLAAGAVLLTRLRPAGAASAGARASDSAVAGEAQYRHSASANHDSNARPDARAPDL